jgi:hypothetical protein
VEDQYLKNLEESGRPARRGAHLATRGVEDVVGGGPLQIGADGTKGSALLAGHRVEAQRDQAVAGLRLLERIALNRAHDVRR